MTIGALARHFDLGTHVLRHWEAMGLLTPATRINGRRRYTQDHLVRVAVILRGKAGGFSLDQIRELLAASTPAARRKLLADQHADLDRRIAELEAAKAMIDHTLNCPAEDFVNCPEFQRLVRTDIEARR